MTSSRDLQPPAASRRPLADQDARDLIRDALDETLAVEAAAGTGKTTVLVDRIVHILASGRTTVDRIVAVTFTEKAAGELKLRLRTHLEVERTNADATTRGRIDHALATLEQAHVSTIHTFCADLLRERPVEARVDPQFTMLTESQAPRLFGEVFRDWLQRALEAPPPGVRRALRRPSWDEGRGPMGRLERAAWTLAEWRDFSAPWRREPFDQHARIDGLVEELASVAALTENPGDPGDSLFVSTSAVRRLFAELSTAERVRPRDYDGLEARLIGLVRELRYPRMGKKTSPYRKGVPRTSIVDALSRLIESLDTFKRDAEASLAALLHEELSEVIDEYQRAKARIGALDFLDLLVLARDLVRDHDAVRRSFQERFTHLFVDEFQDTDPVQAEVLILLAASDPAIRAWRDVRPAPGKLFVVGDPKQSIYRFRRADVGIYEEVREQLARHGARLLTLTASFRSAPTIQRAVNAAFAPLMQGSRETLQASYVPLSPVRDDEPGQPALVALPVPEPFGNRDRITKGAIADSLPDAVGAFVHWLVSESNWTVTERDHPGIRVPVEAKHVCLLFRRFDTASWVSGERQMEDVTRPYVQALESRGIPHLLVGGKSFHDREEVETMRTALAAIEWPDDELSVFGTLRGALFGLGDEPLFEYRRAAGRLHPFRPIRTPLPDRLRPIAEALETLRDLHARRNYRPVAETIDRLLAGSRAHAIFALRPSGEQALANVQYIAELARQYEALGGISFRGFVDQLQEEAESTRASEAPILEEGSDGVRLMTAHKAKGLEFPIVIIADIGCDLSRDNPTRWIDAAERRCAVSLTGWVPVDLLDHGSLEIERDRAEGVRVAYVAATRARDLLVVPAVGDEPLEKGWVNPLNRALYPEWDRRQDATLEPWCAGFGPDSVCDRTSERPLSNVRPGVHTFGDYAVTWWDPARLDLKKEPSYGLRREDLIGKDAPPDIVRAARDRYEAWRTARERAIAEGARPTIRVVTARAKAAQRPAEDSIAGDVKIEVVSVPASSAARASGPRLGALVHAVLASVPLDATTAAVGHVTRQQGRLLGASLDEIASAERSVTAALQHPLLDRARGAASRGGLRREVPLALTAPGADDSLVEGVVDLAFVEGDGWVVIDFKTDQEIGESLDTYRRQVALYVEAIRRATGQPATGVILRL
jgi:ATP-dependent helicase/nuclease subunit A